MVRGATAAGSRVHCMRTCWFSSTVCRVRMLNVCGLAICAHVAGRVVVVVVVAVVVVVVVEVMVVVLDVVDPARK